MIVDRNIQTKNSLMTTNSSGKWAARIEYRVSAVQRAVKDSSTNILLVNKQARHRALSERAPPGCLLDCSGMFWVYLSPSQRFFIFITWHCISTRQSIWAAFLPWRILGFQREYWEDGRNHLCITQALGLSDAPGINMNRKRVDVT